MSNSVPNLLDFARRARVLLASVFALSVSGTYYVEIQLQQPPGFVVDMRSDTNTVAQLFYDVGRGMTESDSVRLPVTASTDYTTLRFPLPTDTIRALRFDPINGAGTFSVRRASVEDSFGSVRRVFARSDLDLPASDREPRRNGVGAHVLDDTWRERSHAPDRRATPNRPLTLDLAPGRAYCGATCRLCVHHRAGWEHVLCRAASGRARRPASRRPASRPPGARHQRSRIPHRRPLCDGMLSRHPGLFRAVGGGRSSRVIDVAVVDRNRRGSRSRAASPWNRERDSRRRVGVSHPRDSPSDLSCDTVRERDDTARARPYVALFQYSRSTRHDDIPAAVLGFLRPAAGLCLFFLLAVQGAALVDWSVFRSPAPDAVEQDSGVRSALVRLFSKHSVDVLVAVAAAGNGRPVLHRDVRGVLHVRRATAGDAGCRGRCLRRSAATNFALCAYIPHQIPLVWLGVFLCIWWVVAKREIIFTRDYALPRIAALGGAWCVVGLAMFAFFGDAERALTTMANTLYPGRTIVTFRRLFDSGAGVALLFLLGERSPHSSSAAFRQHLRVRRFFLAGAGHAPRPSRRQG